LGHAIAGGHYQAKIVGEKKQAMSVGFVSESAFAMMLTGLRFTSLGLVKWEIVPIDHCHGFLLPTLLCQTLNIRENIHLIPNSETATCSPNQFTPTTSVDR
jgi:hypothetical protein